MRKPEPIAEGVIETYPSVRIIIGHFASRDMQNVFQTLTVECKEWSHGKEGLIQMKVSPFYSFDEVVEILEENGFVIAKRGF